MGRCPNRSCRSRRTGTPRPGGSHRALFPDHRRFKRKHPSPRRARSAMGVGATRLRQVLCQVLRLQRMRQSQSARNVAGQIPKLKRSGMIITTHSKNTSNLDFFAQHNSITLSADLITKKPDCPRNGTSVSVAGTNRFQRGSERINSHMDGDCFHGSKIDFLKSGKEQTKANMP
jgi:hypothetical protein